MSDLFGNHIVGFPTMRLIYPFCFSEFATEAVSLAYGRNVSIQYNCDFVNFHTHSLNGIAHLSRFGANKSHSTTDVWLLVFLRSFYSEIMWDLMTFM